MSDSEAQATDVESATVVVQAIVSRVAGTEVGLDQSFFDLGLDSIQLMDICNLINERYGEVIDLFLLFENPTVQECVAIIESHETS
jgi:acyl carrier protein